MGFFNTIIDYAVRFGTMILSAIAVWLIGNWLIKFAGGLVERGLLSRNVDKTLAHYLKTAIDVILRVLLIVAVLGVFGVETTSFAALFAAAGVAIGVAWSGMLSNFAAGIFMVLLRPIKVGDFVSAGGVVGTVREIGMFVTIIDTPDHVKTIVGNNKIFGDNMLNYSANPNRRVDLVAQLNHSVDYKQAIQILKDRLPLIPNVSKENPPVVEILEFNFAGPVLCVRPFCHTDFYWDVYFATNALIKDAFGEAGYPVPEKHYYINRAA
jgi:small conductance mechanosensitive channel